MWALHHPSDPDRYLASLQGVYAAWRAPGTVGPVRLYPSRSEALADALRAGLPDACAVLLVAVEVDDDPPTDPPTDPPRPA